ncbi:MAG: VOC family protein [Gammaproteobacteria bacterium]|nr:VOC family protein [Gammaproteobacteria bacterium]
MAGVDHLTVVAPSCESGVRTFEALTGVRAVAGGRHTVNGTANMLLSLGQRCFLEIMFPDPEGPPAGSLGARLAELSAPTLANYLVATEDMDGLVRAAAALGLAIDPDFTTGRRTPAGDSLSWRIGVVAGHGFGAVVPHFIEWGRTPHPGGSSPGGCTLRSVRAFTPEVAALSRIHAGLGIDVPVASGPRHGLEAVLGTPNGRLTLRRSERVGG